MKRKRGFTIIEVVLVLAIAGLIFLMVFVGLPALQRSQRDAQRKQDMSRMMAALDRFRANNKGNLPDTVYSGGTIGVYNVGPGYSSSQTGWDNFYSSYLTNSEQGEAFNDPSGRPYILYIFRHCHAIARKEGDLCDGQQAPDSWEEQSKSNDIMVVIEGKCDGERIVLAKGNNIAAGMFPSTLSRYVAIAYRLEGGGVVCMSN